MPASSFAMGRVGSLARSPASDELDIDMEAAIGDIAINDVRTAAKLKIEKLKSLLSIKEAKMHKLDESESQCLSRLAALDMALSTVRRLTMVSRKNSTSLNYNPANHNLVQSRARLQSGVYGFGSAHNDFDEDDESSPDEWHGDEEEEPTGFGSSADGTPTGSPVKSGSTSSNISASANRARAAVTKKASMAARRRRLSTTTTATRPSDVPGNREVKVKRATPGQPLGFVLKTVKIAKVDLVTGKPTGEYVDPTFIDKVEPEGLGYQSGLRAGDHILAIDGKNCQALKHEFVVRLLQQNQGTIQLSVRYTTDYRRSVLHRRLAQKRATLVAKVEESEQLQEKIDELVAKSKEITSAISLSSPNSSGTTSSLTSYFGDDLCTSDVLGDDSPWVDDLEGLVHEMQKQWRSERAKFQTQIAKLQDNGNTNASDSGGGVSEVSDELSDALQKHLNRRSTLGDAMLSEVQLAALVAAEAANENRNSLVNPPPPPPVVSGVQPKGKRRSSALGLKQKQRQTANVEQKKKVPQSWV